jgi:hypothetical protein
MYGLTTIGVPQFDFTCEHPSSLLGDGPELKPPFYFPFIFHLRPTKYRENAAKSSVFEVHF